MGIILFAILIVLPIIMTIKVNKISHKLLVLVPFIEYGAVFLFNAIVYSQGHGGVRFDILWLRLGTSIAVISVLVALIISIINNLRR